MMKEQRKKDKTFLVVGRIASVILVLMYISYIAQIISNFQGQKGNPIQPLVAAVNATLWVIYGWINPVKRDWPIIIACPRCNFRFDCRHNMFLGENNST